MQKESSVALKSISLKKVIIAEIITLVTCSCVLLVLSALLSHEILPTGYEKIYVSICLIAGPVIGSSFLAKNMSEKKVFSALWVTIITEILLLLLGIALGGDYFAFSQLPIQLLCISLGSLTGSILSANSRKR